MSERPDEPRPDEPRPDEPLSDEPLSDDSHSGESRPERPRRGDAGSRRPLLPSVTSDETGVGWGDWREEQDDDERFLREVPPHHGTR